jgi:hypothetical protein
MRRTMGDTGRVRSAEAPGQAVVRTVCHGEAYRGVSAVVAAAMTVDEVAERIAMMRRLLALEQE